ncbi:phosphatase PAP2 family protein [Enhydrobacter aerosaccus]|uniref:phosphatase PAP2 family protein n=1 Tax=Enhydrobacter aerosaccus TaxID=225324 RepID=UPI003AF3D7A5
MAHTPDNGFPSDHTLLLSALAALASCWNGRLSLLLWFIALLVGAARVYVGLHHPVDILGSILIAIGTVALVLLVIREVRARP